MVTLPDPMAREAPEQVRIGWREWVRLPCLAEGTLKAKVDTGARTSSLHAFDLVETTRDGEPWLEFSFHPLQRDAETVERGSARLVDRRRVTPSNGQSELRFVVETDLGLDGQRFPIELTLTNRDAMGFRMLLGRRAIRERFLVDVRRSYLGAESKAVRRQARRVRARAKAAEEAAKATEPAR